MKKRTFMMFVISACFLLAMSVFYLAGCSSGGSSDSGASDSSGTSTGTSQSAQELYETDCSACHSLSVVDEAGAQTYDEWLAIVKNMQAKTTTISDSDAEEIAQYLADR